MSHTSASQLYSADGFLEQDKGVGGGIAGAVTAPLGVASGIFANTAPHLHLWGLVLFLVALWGLVRVAGFRFVVTTGVG
jgi:hypothetical protein